MQVMTTVKSSTAAEVSLEAIAVVRGEWCGWIGGIVFGVSASEGGEGW